MPTANLRLVSSESQVDDGDEVTESSKCESLIRALRSGGLKGSYPPQASCLNTFSAHPTTKKVFRDFARRVQQSALRELMPEMKGAAWQVYCAVYGRTFGFGKVAEAITYDHFRFGLRESYPSGRLILNGENPIFRGCGIGSEATITKALNTLTGDGLIGRWAFSERSKPHRIYTPVPIWVLRYEVLGPVIASLRHLGQVRRVELRDALLSEFTKATAGFEDAGNAPRRRHHPMLSLVEATNQATLQF